MGKGGGGGERGKGSGKRQGSERSMVVSFGLSDVLNNHPLHQMKCQECTHRNTERYITDMENQKLLLHSWLHCLMSFPSNPTIDLSFPLLIPTAPPPPPPLPSFFLSLLWVSDTQGIVRVPALAVVYKQDVAAIRRNPICCVLCSQRWTTGGDGKILMWSQVSITHAHMYNTETNTQKYTTSQCKQASKNHAYSLAMDGLTHWAWCLWFLKIYKRQKIQKRSLKLKSKFPPMPDIYANAIQWQTWRKPKATFLLEMTLLWKEVNHEVHNIRSASLWTWSCQVTDRTVSKRWSGLLWSDIDVRFKSLFDQNKIFKIL